MSGHVVRDEINRACGELVQCCRAIGGKLDSIKDKLDRNNELLQEVKDELIKTRETIGRKG